MHLLFNIQTKVCEGAWIMNDETLVNEDHITINNSWSRGTEDVTDIRPKNQGDGKLTVLLYSINSRLTFN